MTPEQMTALRQPFPDSEIGKLPRVTCKDCRESREKVCSKHTKSKCSVCGNYGTSGHIHLDFVGHAELTDRLLDVDPAWSWEPMGLTPEGAPLVTKQGNNLVMWGNLTIHGVTRPGVGTALANKDDAHKELIGDFLRNAAMRFGVALDLWRKTEKAEREHGEIDGGGDGRNETTPRAQDVSPEKEPVAPAAVGDVNDMDRRELVVALADAGLSTAGKEDDLRLRLAAHLAQGEDDASRPFTDEPVNPLESKARAVASKARAAAAGESAA